VVVGGGPGGPDLFRCSDHPIIEKPAFQRTYMEDDE
jgi:hypothetical protein